MAQYLLFLLARPLLARLPRRALIALGVVAGALAYMAAGRSRGAVLRNVSVVLPEATAEELRRLAIRTFIHGAWSYVELLTLSRDGAPDDADIRIEGWEHVDRALERGKGVIMAGAHIGPTALGGQAVCARGIPTTVVVEQLEPPAFHHLTVELRARTGLRQIPLGPGALREVVEALRRNEIVGIGCDRDVAGSGETLPFFGRPTQMTTAPAAIGLRTGALVLPALAYRTRSFTAVAQIQEPVEIPRTGDTVADIREGTLRILQRIEAFIRQHPEQWAVFSDIWPARASDEVPTDRS